MLTRESEKKTSNEIQDSYPLSPMQQGMLFHSLYAPRSGVYIEQITCVLHEVLDVPALKRAWQWVVERHPVLRTAFRWEGLDQPVQDVYRHVTTPWEEHDWRRLSVREQEDQLAAYLEADRRRGFELDEAPLMRLALFRVNEPDYRFVWTSHHALLDGRSYLTVSREFFSSYDALCQGHNLSLPPPRPYRDYIHWLGKQDFSKSENFWRNRLKGFISPTPLGVDRPHPSRYDNEGNYGRQASRLSETMTQALQSLAQQHHLTVNTLIQRAWALLLSRYSGEEDIVFGATRAARHTTLETAQAMVGLFINTLPVRVQVTTQTPLLAWLKELRDQWVAMRQDEHTPLVKVQEWSDLRAGDPLFESLLVFENYLLNSTLRRQGGNWMGPSLLSDERTIR